MKKLRFFITKYKYAIPMLIYFAIYLTWFVWLEKTNTKNYWVIHMKADDYIPFCEFFVIPYLLWFLYVFIVVAYVLFNDKQEFKKACAFLMTGMTVFLVISTLWPNGHHLRLTEMPRDNIFTAMVEQLWKTDTATNLWPSIHVYNSLGAHFAVIHCKKLMDARFGFAIKIGSGILAVSIILSTVFLKQHSVFDLLTGLAMGAVMYAIVYRRELLLAGRSQRNRTPQVD